MESRSWTASEKRIPFQSTKRDVGPGEARFAEAIGGTLLGGSGYAYDVKGPSGERYEVKVLDDSGQLRPGVEGRNAAVKLRNLLDVLCDDLESLDADVLAARDDFPLDEFQRFVSENVEQIKKGEITLNRLFGTAEEFGLTDAIEAVARLKNDSDGEHDVALDGQVHPVDDSQFARVGAIVGLDPADLGVDPIDAALASLRSPVFDDPERIVSAWDALTASAVFHATTQIALVSEEGYTVLSPSELDDHLVLARISQGLPRFRFVK